MIEFYANSLSYYDEVDHIILPSKFMAEKYGFADRDKCLYLGSSKYDVELDKDQVLKKYNLPKEKERALVLAPRTRDLNNFDLNKMYKILRKHNYDVVVKSRGKDRLPDRLMGDYYFEDASWFPHTSMELMKVSDIIINFSSTAIKET